MARIAESELERLKAEVSVARLIEASGIKLEKRGRDLIGACPFGSANSGLRYRSGPKGGVATWA